MNGAERFDTEAQSAFLVWKKVLIYPEFMQMYPVLDSAMDIFRCVYEVWLLIRSKPQLKFICETCPRKQ